MRAFVLNSANSLSLEDIKRPQSESGKALIRVSHSGICGTDLKIYQGDIPVSYPRIMGHESVGEIVDGSMSGAPVIVDPVYSCGACYVCDAGQPNLCPNGGLIGRDVDGGLADYLSAPLRNIYVLPEEIDPAEAPLLQPMTTCLHAQRRANIFPGEAVVVMGLGVTGLLHVQLAKARGAFPVIGISRSKEKLELAEKLGADYSFQSDEDVKDRVLDITEGRGADLVIESVGKLPILAQAIDLARIGGRLLAFGIFTETEGELPFYDFYFKELNLINARAAKSQDFPASIELLRRGAVDLRSIISHSLPLDNIVGALDLLDQGDSGRLKIIMKHTV